MWDNRGMSNHRPTITRREGLELLAAWRRRADSLDRQAAMLRQDGDLDAAEDLEETATDYRIACDSLDLDTLPAELPAVA